MIIFVSAPYTAERLEDIEANVSRALDAGCVLMEKGHSPIIPHLSHHLDLHATARGFCFNYARWMEFTLSLVHCCDAILYLAPSPGADRELELAERLGKKIYLHLDAVPDMPEAS